MIVMFVEFVLYKNRVKLFRGQYSVKYIYI